MMSIPLSGASMITTTCKTFSEFVLSLDPGLYSMFLEWLCSNGSK